MAAEVSINCEEPVKARYFGQTQKQLREGCGTYIYENRFFRYEGQWHNGKKHGHGRLTMADGSYYEGAFVDGEIEGKGLRFFASTGNTYVGDFRQGEGEGQGIMQYSDGSSYEGNWSGNRRQGYGIHRMSNGAVYQGNFHDHKRHCEGILIYSNGSSYNGNWVKDIKQGHGVMTYAEGSVYSGQWLYDVRHGQGCFTDAVSGIKYDGMWINDHPQNISTRLVIIAPTDVTRGEFFSLTVGCYRSDNSLNSDDEGRSVQLMCGIKLADSVLKTFSLIDMKSPSVEKKPSSDEKVTSGEEKGTRGVEEVPSKNSSSLSRRSSSKSGRSEAVPNGGLVKSVLPSQEKHPTDGQIEDQDELENHLMTPFGYKVGLCRLVEREFLPRWQLDASASQDQLEKSVSLDSATAQEMSNHQTNKTADVESPHGTSADSSKKEKNSSHEGHSGTVGELKKEAESLAKESEPRETSSNMSSDVVNLQCCDSSLSEPTLVPMQSIVRKTADGESVFEFIAVASMEECDRKVAGTEETDKSTPQRDTVSKASIGKKDTRDGGSKSASRLSNKKEVPAEAEVINTGESDSGKCCNSAEKDELFAELGEYVLIVKDITEPPFLGMPLEPAYHVIRIVERKSSNRSESADMMNSEERQSMLGLQQDAIAPVTGKS